MEVDDIINYHDVVSEEKASLKKGNELWSREEISDLSDVVARERAVSGRTRSGHGAC
jgi:hypothetical protein